jgi:hypothetical protein
MNPIPTEDAEHVTNGLLERCFRYLVENLRIHSRPDPSGAINAETPVNETLTCHIQPTMFSFSALSGAVATSDATYEGTSSVFSTCSHIVPTGT